MGAVNHNYFLYEEINQKPFVSQYYPIFPKEHTSAEGQKRLRTQEKYFHCTSVPKQHA